MTDNGEPYSRQRITNETLNRDLDEIAIDTNICVDTNVAADTDIDIRNIGTLFFIPSPLFICYVLYALHSDDLGLKWVLEKSSQMIIISMILGIVASPGNLRSKSIIGGLFAVYTAFAVEILRYFVT